MVEVKDWGVSTDCVVGKPFSQPWRCLVPLFACDDVRSYVDPENAKAIAKKQIIAGVSLSYLTGSEPNWENGDINKCMPPSCPIAFFVSHIPQRVSSLVEEK